MKNKLLIILQFLFCISWSSFGQSQNMSVQGNVVAVVNAEPLAGVNILIKGSSYGTISDVDGHFRLNAGPIDTLIFSYIGYETLEVPVKARAIINIALTESLEVLQDIEVFSTGYEEIPAERATGSFTHIDNELINRRVSPDILSRLEDVTGGLIFSRARTGSGQLRKNDINIRGRSTIYSDDQPLIIVDNFPYDGDIESINPNDVEKITVLKDAAAASIWGARAGNGVIVITTKSGQFNQKAQLSFNSNITISDEPDLFYAPKMSTSDFIDIEKMLFDQGFYAGTEYALNKAPLTPVVELLIAGRDGVISEDEAAAAIDDLRKNDVRKDFEEYFYRRSVNQQYAVSLKGGTHNQRYFLSAGFDKMLENLKGNESERMTLNASNTYRLLDGKLEISTGLYYAHAETQTNNPGMDRIVMQTNTGAMYPYARLADDLGNPLPITHNYRTGFIAQAEADGLLNWQYKPLEELHLADNTNQLNDYRMNAGLTYKVLPGLTFKLLYQYSRTMTASRNLQSQQTFYTRDLINRLTQVESDGSLTRPVPVGDILDLDNGLINSRNFRGQVNYQKEWGNHNINAIAGWERKDVKDTRSSHRLYGYDDETALSTKVDYVTRYRQYFWPILTMSIPNYDSEAEITDRYLSWYANTAYTYNDRYTLSASARFDQSNLFGVETNQRGVPLWSAGLSWNMGEEAFYNLGWLPFLKLRMTYGFNGNVNKNVTAFTTARYVGTSRYARQPYAQVTNPPNPNLRWEKVKMFNAGLDFESRNSVLSGSIEYYVKKGIDLIGDISLPPSTGIREYRGNTAQTKGSGLDVRLNSNNLNGNLKWQTNLLLSHASSKVTSYDIEEVPFQYIQSGDGAGTYPLEGKPLYALYSYRYGGLDPDTGDPQGYLDGEISKEYNAIINETTIDDIIYHGPATPTVFGALRNNLTWKGFSFSVNISYRLGYYFRKQTVMYQTVLSGRGGHSDYEKRWQKPGDENFTNIPSMPSSRDTNRDRVFAYSEALVEKGDHIRLQDMTFGYAWERSRWPSLPFERAQLYTYVNNIGILWKAADNVPDPDYQNHKLLTTYAIGVKVDF